MRFRQPPPRAVQQAVYHRRRIVGTVFVAPTVFSLATRPKGKASRRPRPRQAGINAMQRQHRPLSIGSRPTGRALVRSHPMSRNVLLRR